MTISKRGVGFLLSAVLVLVAACDKSGDETGADGTTAGETGTPVYSHAADIQPIWDTYCVAECHEPEGIDEATGVYIPVWPGVTLDLSTSAVAYEQLIDGESLLYTAADPFVTPGDSENSYLVGKITFMPAENGGGGLFMPQQREGEPDQIQLTDAEIQIIIDWIDGGAMP